MRENCKLCEISDEMAVGKPGGTALTDVGFINPVQPPLIFDVSRFTGRGYCWNTLTAAAVATCSRGGLIRLELVDVALSFGRFGDGIDGAAPCCIMPLVPDDPVAVPALLDDDVEFGDDTPTPDDDELVVNIRLRVPPLNIALTSSHACTISSGDMPLSFM